MWEKCACAVRALGETDVDRIAITPAGTLSPGRPSKRPDWPCIRCTHVTPTIVDKSGAYCTHKYVLFQSKYSHYRHCRQVGGMATWAMLPGAPTIARGPSTLSLRPFGLAGSRPRTLARRFQKCRMLAGAHAAPGPSEDPFSVRVPPRRWAHRAGPSVGDTFANYVRPLPLPTRSCLESLHLQTTRPSCEPTGYE